MTLNRIFEVGLHNLSVLHFSSISPLKILNKKKKKYRTDVGRSSETAKAHRG
eukprot:TRINITY_DN5420_c0_g1_i1.p1 TRINITY_DN5420_c0_g1~~TRINITY_DN5420_c0_g1_i1.p1  ORF type:complete len:52 (+),score=9.28 TRINITY_DN5420_c0_g1_i1:387-542(+)